ncbi:IRR1 (YIL026C) [Zygosaccharomyces parabailii]|nr:IRR1 (YIL026C) [Zygosaccharomyces parabailii]CDH14380.1 related to Cohesin subunit SCC3 [Zygosaccharomyces bailii ISA1307]
MSEVRRSSRIRTKSNENASATEAGSKDEQRLNGSDGESDSENESESEGDVQDDEDYEEPSKKRRAGSNSKGAPRQKRAKSAGMSRPSTTSKQEQENYLETIKDFQPTELFEILSTSEDVSIDELLRNWLESYSTDRDVFLQDFINLLLCCCGAIARLEAHDVHSNESSNETVGELQLLFQKQKVHEFHLLISKNSKKKTKYPHLYANFVEFMSRLMDIANDLQLLYVESDQDESEISTGPLVLDLLTWLSPLSVCKIRSLRYVATLTLYLFQDFLADHVVDLDKNYLSKLSKQLAAENKKKKPSLKTLEKIEGTIAEIQGSKMVTQGIIDNIIKLCFVHRFKDVDEAVRCESMIHLSAWIKSYPEYFLKVTFLKYFGWLLSDSSANVRLQVLKILPNLIVQSHRKAVDNSAVRQFFERFKDRILEIALKDVNLEVKLSAVNVLVEVASLGYLEDGEILLISSLIFEDNKVNISSHGRNSRYLGSVAKFISCITEERYQEFSRNRDLPKSLFDVEPSSAVKVGIFMNILNDSLAEHLRQEAHSDAETKIRILFQAAEFLYPYFGSLINDLCRMLIFEGDFGHPSLQTSVEVEENNLTLLLPTDSNNVVLYVTTLHGLSYGGKYAKSQSRFKVAEAILPHLEKLIKHMPIESSNILSSMLGIFNLFSFEDWLHTGCEKDIRKIVEKIIKAFNETNLCSGPEDMKYKSFLEAVEHVRKLAFNELDELWLNHITYLKIHLVKFLGEKIQNSESSQSTDDDKMVNALYGSFLNKLTLLGKVYPIEFEDKLLDLFLNGYVRRVPAIAAHCQLESVQEINFKLLSLLSTWQLQKWVDLLEKSSETTVPSQVPISSFKTVKALLDSFYSIFKVLASDLNDNDGTLEDFLLKWSAANSFIDILISLKVFELGVADSERSWKSALMEQFPHYIQESANLVFLQVFLYLESLYASESSVQLDRNPEEDANLNDIKYAGFEGNSEKELLLFTIKLKAVMKLGVRLSNDHIATRISLNKEKLGVLYTKVIDDKSFEGSKDDKASGSKQLLKDHSNEELEPIDEQSQEDEPAEISMIGHESIDDSEI